jgi:diaminohydroxyphosphoribosylaminopyrimidine deaminase/5-amino-6-(5-phosphoribosylamino)uracil reductase
VIGVVDPDTNVSGQGVEQLTNAGVEVITAVAENAVQHQLRAYLHHRRTGRPYVVAKMAATQNGSVVLGTSMPTSERTEHNWITGVEARTRVHQLRAESDAICVGAGTVRADNPALTVRMVTGRDPLRFVLGEVEPDARVHPCVQWNSGYEELLDHLGKLGMIQLMVEGGPGVLTAMRQQQLIDELVLHVSTKPSADFLGVFKDVSWDEVRGWFGDARVAVASLGSDTEYTIPRAVIGA